MKQWKLGGKFWFKGKWYVDLGDARYYASPMQSSRLVWDPMGTLEVHVNLQSTKRIEPIQSGRAIGRALQNLFGTKGGYICEVYDGYGYKEYVATTVVWYAKCPERPEIEKAERIREVIFDAAIEPQYEAFVKATGDTEVWLDSELPYGYQNAIIRKYCSDVTAKEKVINGRIWRLKRTRS